MRAFTAALKGIGWRVKELRKARGWTQEELAGEAGLSRTYLGTIELGTKQATLWTLFRVATALKVSMAELLLAPMGGPAQGEDIIARIETRLREAGRSISELRKIEDLIDAYLGRSR